MVFAFENLPHGRGNPRKDGWPFSEGGNAERDSSVAGCFNNVERSRTMVF